MTEPILRVSDLSAYYGKKKALNNVSIDFYSNEITALIGPSGSGKSTLMRSINRMNDLNPEVTLTGSITYNNSEDVPKNINNLVFNRVLNVKILIKQCKIDT